MLAAPGAHWGDGDWWGGHPGSRQWLWSWGADAALTPHRAKYINVTLALSTTRFLSQETAYMPWEAALNNLHYFQLMFDRSEVFGVMTVSSATCPAPALQWVLPLGRASCWVGMGRRGWICTQSWAGGCCRCHRLLTVLPSPQQYIQKQVMPLFSHYKNITNNWVIIPSDLMDQ